MGVVWGGLSLRPDWSDPLPEKSRPFLDRVDSQALQNESGRVDPALQTFISTRQKREEWRQRIGPPLLYIGPIALSGVDPASLRMWGCLIGHMAVGKMMPLGAMREASFVGMSPNGSPAQEDPFFVPG